MPNGDKPSPRRNWYKAATLALSATMVVIMFVSGIYYKLSDERVRRMDAVQDKIGKFLDQRAKVSELPKVEISLLTLEKSGLPRSAFSGLAEVPAVVRVSHVGGRTARGISVDIESNSKILRFVPDSSVEIFSHTVAEDGKSLRIDIEQLRRKSVVSGTVLCEGIGALRADARVDQGQVLGDAAGSQPRQLADKLDFGDLDKLESTVYRSEKHIDAVVEKLRDLLARERNPPQEEGNTLFSGFVLTVLSALSLSALALITVHVVDRRKNKRLGIDTKRLGNKIGLCKERGTITIGMPEDEVRGMLGEPGKIGTIQDENGFVAIWSYEPQATLFSGWQPDAFVKLREGRVQSVEYREYGKRIYTAEQEKSGGT